MITKEELLRFVNSIINDTKYSDLAKQGFRHSFERDLNELLGGGNEY